MKIWLIGAMVGFLLSCPLSNVSAQPKTQEALTQSSEKMKVPILMYHSIGNDPSNELVILPQRFREEMSYLKKAGYTPIHFDQLEWRYGGGVLPAKPIIVTLDDGYEDNYREGFPILKQTRMKATIFIITDVVNKPQRVTWEQMKEMQSTGIIEFGAHTKNHVDLKKSSQHVQHEEIEGSKQVLEAKLGKTVSAFAYPAGRYSPTTVQEVENAGFSYAVTTKPGWAEPKQGLLTLHRVRINGSLSLNAFKRMFP
ncbi:MAG TPA: polysaccharide deacetylase family protein [Bacillota bacterium]|nr:polysaccharide deacetylase family protein [Bacillota bacterium]